MNFPKRLCHFDQVNLEILHLEGALSTLVQMGLHQIHEISSKCVHIGALQPSQNIISHFTYVFHI